MNKNQIYFEFVIRGYDSITHEYITKLLEIVPDIIYVKNEPMGSKSKILAAQNGWRIKNSLSNKYALFEDQLSAMLDLLEPKTDVLKMLKEKYNCSYEFSLAIFLFNQNESAPWVHLDERYNRFIRKVEVEFDLDLYNPPKE